MSSYVYHIIILDIDLYDLISFYQIILFNHIVSLLYLRLFIFYLLLYLQFYIILSLTSMTHHMSCFTLRPNTDALYLLSADSSNISLSSSQSNFCLFFFHHLGSYYRGVSERVVRRQRKGLRKKHVSTCIIYL